MRGPLSHPTPLSAGPNPPAPVPDARDDGHCMQSEEMKAPWCAPSGGFHAEPDVKVPRESVFPEGVSRPALRVPGSDLRRTCFPNREPCLQYSAGSPCSKELPLTKQFGHRTPGDAEPSVVRCRSLSARRTGTLASKSIGREIATACPVIELSVKRRPGESFSDLVLART